jgi:hypothetical protein
MGNGALTSPLNAQTAKTLAGDHFDAAFFSEAANDDGTLPPDIATKWASEHHVTPTAYAIHSLSKEKNKTFHPTNLQQWPQHGALGLCRCPRKLHQWLLL